MSLQQKKVWEELKQMRNEIENHTDLGWMIQAIDNIANYIGLLEEGKENPQKSEEENNK